MTKPADRIEQARVAKIREYLRDPDKLKTLQLHMRILAENWGMTQCCAAVAQVAYKVA